ncbi:diguanylate phosphodiesterase [Erwinia sp. S38]|uniref:diguanylate phosphodiesterase n=1 Tax=Erwinia sp. S38 TaxID=2769338 RepID=UPI00190D8AAF|nr:diguanylate phosphodiesterase [Erwinia sp. S38]MBK0004267.1 diguanylate phosphodiesterase [Erwinia sp. S38]
MLTTLIYRSRVSPETGQENVHKLVQHALDKNRASSITGILLFDGTEFFQVLEGEDAVVNALFNRIATDQRHSSVVLLMQDYSAYRRFQDTGMRLFDVSSHTEESIIKDILNFSHFKGNYLQDDRIMRLTRKFLGGIGLHITSPEFNPSSWYLEGRENFEISSWPAPVPEQPCQFALQPIIDALTGKISSYEALIRSPSGGSPFKMFQSIPADRLYLFDIETKFYAFKLAKQLLKHNEKLSVNLLPGVLYSIPGAVNILIQQISDAGLRPEQIIVEVTETEAITDQDVFHQALKELRVAGIGLAIDDFGAGFSGLALLTKFQPDKIKIDRALIEDIHLSGVKQAIVRSIAQCCDELGITLVAEGVELMEEWYWLESTGIHLFQGFLFSRPSLNDTGIIRWPLMR